MPLRNLAKSKRTLNRLPLFRKIVLANDGSDEAAKALPICIDLAKSHDAELLMISVEELPGFPTIMEEIQQETAAGNQRLRAVIRRAKAQAQSYGVTLSSHVLIGDAVQQILEFTTKESADLLVIGFAKHSALYNRLIGGTMNRLVEHTSCSVLVVK